MDTERQVRTFVFISGIPSFLLEPMRPPPSGTRGAAAKRDMRYERLRRLLAHHTSGVMLVMHLESKGYALALYASEEEALDACMTTIVPVPPGAKRNDDGESDDDENDGASTASAQYPPLRLRVLEKERPPPPEAVYSPTMQIEGETVEKSSLADTRGLELVYKGRRIPKWCQYTLEEEDCPMGVTCLRVHKKVHQTTVRKRARLEEFDNEEQSAPPAADPSSDTSGQQGSSDSHPHAPAAVRRRLESASLSTDQLHAVVPESLLLPMVHIPLDDSSIAALLQEGGERTLPNELIHRAKEGVSALPKGPLFVRLNVAGGTPVDWPLTSSAGLAEMRARCPLPSNGAPTPLERDLFCQKMLMCINELCAFQSVEDALAALTRSERVKRILHRHVKSGSSTSLSVCFTPWLRLPTVAYEARLFLEVVGDVSENAHNEGQGRGPKGVEIRGVVQHHDRLRLMKVDAFAKDDMRYAILESRNDEDAERAMEDEMEKLSRLFTRTAEELQRSLRQRLYSTPSSDTAALVPLGTRWCFNVAVGCPATSSECSTHHKQCRVLSTSPYYSALQECFFLNSLAGKEMRYNTTKHPYTPHFSRDVMELLRVQP